MAENLENKDSKQDGEISAGETLSERQPWLPASTQMSAVGGMYEELSEPASRYQLPFSHYEKLELALRQRISDASDIAEASVFRAPSDFVPRRWRAVIQYLYEIGVLSRPEVQIEPLFNDEPKIYMLRLWASSVEGLTDGVVDLKSGGGYSRGVSRDIDEAFSKVVGELLERYPLTIYRDKELLRASVADLKRKGRHFLNPFLVDMFSEEQKKNFPKRQFDEKSSFRWVEGKSLMTGKPALVPAQMVFWNYRFGDDEPVIQQPITNGAGGMFTSTEAILAGLYELIQRDSFFVHWFNKIPPKKIKTDLVEDERFKTILRDMERYNITPHILDITSDIGVPAFAVALEDAAPNSPSISIGGGCGPIPERAILRALTESMGVCHWLRFGDMSSKTTLAENYKPFSVPLGQIERLYLWGNHKMRKEFDFFLEGSEAALKEWEPNRKLKNPGDELDFLKDEFSKRGEEYEIFYYEARHPALDALGYHSASVSVPALLPLYMNETFAPLGAKRIQAACRGLGRAPAEKINILPHPFP